MESALISYVCSHVYMLEICTLLDTCEAGIAARKFSILLYSLILCVFYLQVGQFFAPDRSVYKNTDYFLLYRAMSCDIS